MALLQRKPGATYGRRHDLLHGMNGQRHPLGLQEGLLSEGLGRGRYPHEAKKGHRVTQTTPCYTRSELDSGQPTTANRVTDFALRTPLKTSSQIKAPSSFLRISPKLETRKCPSAGKRTLCRCACNGTPCGCKQEPMGNSDVETLAPGAVGDARQKARAGCSVYAKP